jgi:chemotaxis signal transduction protein
MSGARKRFDWRQIHDRLDRGLARLESTYEHDPARVAVLLKERSVRLAKRPADRAAAATLSRVLVFGAGGERFGLALANASEICPITRMAALPGAAAAIVGIVNWRGEFVFVCDAARLVGAQATTDSAARHAIILRGSVPRTALAVDSLDGIASVDLARLQPVEPLGLTRRDLFKGMSEDAVLVLDGERLLARLNEELQAA